MQREEPALRPGTVLCHGLPGGWGRSLGVTPCRDGTLHSCHLHSLGHELTSAGPSDTKRALTPPLALQTAVPGESELERGVQSQGFLGCYQTFYCAEIKDTASMPFSPWLALGVSSLCVRRVSLKLKAIPPCESSF